MRERSEREREERKNDSKLHTNLQKTKDRLFASA